MFLPSQMLPPSIPASLSSFYRPLPCFLSPRMRISADIVPFLFIPQNIPPNCSGSHFFPSQHLSKWILNKELPAWWDWSLLCYQIIVFYSKLMKTIPITPWCNTLQQLYDLQSGRYKRLVQNLQLASAHQTYDLTTSVLALWTQSNLKRSSICP